VELFLRLRSALTAENSYDNSVYPLSQSTILKENDAFLKLLLTAGKEKTYDTAIQWSDHLTKLSSRKNCGGCDIMALNQCLSVLSGSAERRRP